MAPAVILCCPGRLMIFVRPGGKAVCSPNTGQDSGSAGQVIPENSFAAKDNPGGDSDNGDHVGENRALGCRNPA